MNKQVILLAAVALCLFPAYGRAENWLSLNDPKAAAAGATTSGSVPAASTVVLLDDSAAAVTPSNQWRLSLELPIWAAGIDGTVGVRGFTAPTHVSFIDILEKTDNLIGLGLRAGVGYGPWTFVVDGLYMKLGKDVNVGPASVDFKADLALVDADLYYRVGRWNLNGGQESSKATALSLDVGPGARYMHVGMHLNTKLGLSRTQNADWADPLAATQIILDFDKHWRIVTRADVGGGVGSDFTWSGGMFGSYRFALSQNVNAAVELGYKAVGENHRDGSGNQKFTWDAIMHGPVISFTVEF